MSHSPVIVGLGETLWDCLPDAEYLGGAPLNFCCSAAELAQGTAQVFMVSAVGSDDRGRRALTALTDHGVDTSAVQTAAQPTGYVSVKLDAQGVASYEFASDCAWDHISWRADVERLAAKCEAVCFGTLAQRHGPSRDSIQRFVASTPAKALRVLDVNLRTPFVDDDVIRESLKLANFLKLNDDELPVVGNLVGCSPDAGDVIPQLADRFELRGVALTRGPQGAQLQLGDTTSEIGAVEVDVHDTVGAGDAYAAAMVLGMLANWDVERINQRAVEVASFACSQGGATMQFPPTLHIPLCDRRAGED